MTYPAPQRPVCWLPFLRRGAAGAVTALGIMASSISAPQAALTGYTDFAAFQSGLSAGGLSANTLDFDSLTAGDLIATGSSLGL